LRIILIGVYDSAFPSEFLKKRVVLYTKVLAVRKTLSYSLAFMLLLSMSTGAFIQVQGEESPPQVSVRSLVEIKEGALIIVNNTFTLSRPPNTAFVDVATFFIGLPSVFAGYVDYRAFYLWHNDRWVPLSGSAAIGGNGTRGFRLILPNPVRLEGSKVLSLRSVFLLSETAYVYGQGIIVNFPLYPSLSSNISTCEIEVRLPKGAAPTNIETEIFSTSVIDGTYVLSHSRVSLAPFQTKEATIVYSAGTSSNLIVRCEKLQRVMNLTPPSKMKIQDTYTLLNLGSELTSYAVKIPINSFDISVEEYLGKLAFNSETVEKEGYAKVGIVPRINIRTNERWSFTLEYSLPLKEYVETGTGDSLYLKYLFLSNFGFTVRQLEVTVILPEGGEYSASTPAPNTMKKVGLFIQEVFYKRENATILDNLSLHLTYTYNYLWTAFRPTLWSILLVLGAAGAYQILRSRKQKELEVSEDRLPLRRFVELYEEKLPLSAEGDKLDEDIDERRISRSDYNKKREMLDSRISKVESLLKTLRDRIKHETPQFEKVVREIEIAEVEIETEKTNLRELETRLRSRGITRDAYRRLRQEYLGRIRRARSRIERAILTLREEAY